MPSPLASLEDNSREINVRSPRYYIARTIYLCRHCGSPTALVGIAVPLGHETLDVDDDAAQEGGETSQPEHPAAAWSTADHNAFLFYVDSLPAAVWKRINRYQPAYRPPDPDAGATPAQDPAAAGCSDSYLANHCEKCGCRLDDHELFCEPEGPFLPTSASAAAAIRLVPVDEPFEACAAGYSFEPPLFYAMTRG